jgi:hypothetical protein
MKEHEQSALPFRPMASNSGPPSVQTGMGVISTPPTGMDMRREQELRQSDQLWRQLCIQQAVAACAGKAWTCEDVAILAERFYAFGTNK